jgi:hypothetical protein
MLDDLCLKANENNKKKKIPTQSAVPTRECVLQKRDSES